MQRAWLRMLEEENVHKTWRKFFSALKIMDRKGITGFVVLWISDPERYG